MIAQKRIHDHDYLIGICYLQDPTMKELKCIEGDLADNLYLYKR